MERKFQIAARIKKAREESGLSQKELFGHTKITTTQIYLDAYNSEQATIKHVKFSPVDNF